MRKLLSVLCVITLPAQAGIIDFRDSQFASSFVGGAFSRIVTFGDVDFAVTPVSRGANGFTRVSEGQNFGVGGNGLFSLAFVATQDLVFTSLSGRDRSNLDSDTEALPFDLLLDGGLIESGHQFLPTGSIWDFADISVSAGSTFLIRETGGGDANSNAVLSSLSFSNVREVNEVPAPGPIGLLGAGLVAIAGLRRNRAGSVEPK